MIHPLLRLLATEPQILGDHVEAYADLIGDELRKTSAAWGLRIGLYLAALALAGVGVVLTGVAIMLWAAVPPASSQMPWLLVAVPAVNFVAAAICVFVARKTPVENAFDNVKKQLSADMAILREVSAP